jgi:hypothetical protein
MITQAIQTKYLPHTNTRPSRIKAWCQRGSVTITTDCSLESDHREAVRVLLAKFIAEDEERYGTPRSANPWAADFVLGALPGAGYVAVAVKSTTVIATLKDFDFCGCENFAQLGRAVYEGTECGPWMVAILPDGTEVYYEDEEARAILPETQLKAIKVGSIVEGSGAEAAPRVCEDPAKLSEIIEEVNADASALWDEANGDGEEW